MIPPHPELLRLELSLPSRWWPCVRAQLVVSWCVWWMVVAVIMPGRWQLLLSDNNDQGGTRNLEGLSENSLMILAKLIHTITVLRSVKRQSFHRWAALGALGHWEASYGLKTL